MRKSFVRSRLLSLVPGLGATLLAGWLLAGMLLAGCAPPPDAGTGTPAAPPALDLSGYRILDMSYPFDENTIYWPTSPTSFQLEQLSYGVNDAGFFYSSNSICTPEHGGTHLDAPIHFAEGRWTADQIPLDRLIRPAVVIDVSAKAAADADYRLTVEDVQAWEAEHGEVPADSIVLLHTGWGKFWPDRKQYLGDDTPGDASNLHFPSYGAEAVQYLVEQRKVSVIGVDTASIDYGPSKDFPVHRLANGANVPGLENVAHLEELPATGAWIVALPMKIAGGSGGPVRIAGLLPR